jgi:thiamine-monophosphate kinase
MVTVGDIGEFALIERIAAWVADGSPTSESDRGFKLQTGIGDDAAVWISPGGTQISTIDTVVEGIHFLNGSISWLDIGWRLMVSNVSDIAAMGAVPLCATVALGIPSHFPVRSVEDLYRGMLEASRTYQIYVIGGDVVSSPTIFVTVSLNGAMSEIPLSRSKARSGDAILVTGPLGGSAGGLKVILDEIPVDSDARMALVQLHQRPWARVQEGRSLIELGILCAMDISDGLLVDLKKLVKSSGVGAYLEVDRVPVCAPLRLAFPTQALQLAVTGGEDYQLLFTCPSELLDSVFAVLPSSSIVGEITASDSGRVVISDPRDELGNQHFVGWEHFRS